MAQPCVRQSEIFLNFAPQPTLRLIISSCPPTQPPVSAVQLISSILFLSCTCKEKRTERGKERGKWSERKDEETCSNPMIPVSQLDEEIIWMLGWMLHDLQVWNVNTKGSIKIIPGAFSFSFSSSSVSSSFSLTFFYWLYASQMVINYAPPPFTTFTISLFHSSFSFPFCSAKWPCPDIFLGLLCNSPTSSPLFSPLPRGSVCKRAEEKNDGTNYETQECIPYLV